MDLHKIPSLKHCLSCQEHVVVVLVAVDTLDVGSFWFPSNNELTKLGDKGPTATATTDALCLQYQLLLLLLLLLLRRLEFHQKDDIVCKKPKSPEPTLYNYSSSCPPRCSCCSCYYSA